MAKKKGAKKNSKPKKDGEKKVGRKTKYDTHVKPFIDLVEFWYMNGATDKEVADNLKIAESTLYEYKNKYPEFSEASARTKLISDARVQSALYKNATENMDFKAQKYWLQNRQPDLWKDKQEIKFSGDDNFEIKINVIGRDENES